MESLQSILVAGGAGFIGSHLCDALLALGHKVICLDSIITGNEDNLKEVKKDVNFTFVHHDVTKTLPSFDHVNYIFHLASPASVIDYQKYPEETALANAVGTRNLLQIAQKNKAKFLFASTSEVYGDPKEHPQKETYWGNVNPNGVRACYDESKRFGEMMTMLYYRKFAVDTRIVRIFNTYGPRMRKTDGRVISNFINQALEHKPLIVYGDGSQTRSFCYVSDLIDGIIKMMFSDKTKGEVVNLGNPAEFRMIDLAKKIQKMTGSSSQVVFGQLPEDDPVCRQPDITKATTLLNWHPHVSLDEGLTKTIAYYQET